MTDTLEGLRARLGHRIASQDLLRAALTHRSASRRNNERLEFLGDAVLNLVISDALYECADDADEGHLSRLRASLVRGSTLAAVAAELDLGQHLRMGAGELKSGGYRRKSVLADALEALIGATFLDGGYAAARDFVLALFAGRLDELPAAADLKDAKTLLQEALQGRGLPLPLYRLEESLGEPHQREFVASCEVAELGIAVRGKGGSRRKAEQEAARLALVELHGD